MAICDFIWLWILHHKLCKMPFWALKNRPRSAIQINGAYCVFCSVGSNWKMWENCLAMDLDFGKVGESLRFCWKDRSFLSHWGMRSQKFQTSAQSIRAWQTLQSLRRIAKSSFPHQQQTKQFGGNEKWTPLDGKFGDFFNPIKVYIEHVSGRAHKSCSSRAVGEQLYAKI